MTETAETDAGTAGEAPSRNLVWFRELRPFATILLTAVAGGVTTYCSVDKHAQRTNEQELALKTEQFQAEELSKYLALPMKEAVSKRAMATYLQAVFFSRGDTELHRWATKQIDQVDADTRIRRSILQERAIELQAATTRRDELIRKRLKLDQELDTAASASLVADIDARLKALAPQITAATTEVETMRSGFDEETQLAADLRSPALEEAQRAESVGGCCDAMRAQAQAAVGKAKDTLSSATSACLQMASLGQPFADVSVGLKKATVGLTLPAKCLSP